MRSSAGIWGLLMQCTTYTVLMPLWCFAYLSLSRTISSRRLSDFLVSVPDLAGIAFAMVNVYLLLTLLMSLPAPSVISHDLKQRFIAFWNFFPLWVSLSQGAVAYLLPRPREEADGAPPSSRSVIWMRALYAGLLTAACLGQAKTLALMWTSRFLPDLFAREFLGVFDFSKVFIPATTSPYTKMPSIGAGAFLLLQYDYFIGSTALALWSTVMFINTYKNGTTEWSVALMIGGGFVMLALTGPLGYATAFIWARDELIIAETEPVGKKVQ